MIKCDYCQTTKKTQTSLCSNCHKFGKSGLEISTMEWFANLSLEYANILLEKYEGKTLTYIYSKEK